MFQDGALFSTLTVRENVMAPMREHTKIPHAADARARRPQAPAGRARTRSRAQDARQIFPAACASAPRWRARWRSIRTLSFSTSRRPASIPIGAQKFDELVQSLSRALGLTVFLVTHDLDTLVAICDRVAVLSDGKVLAVGPLEEVRKNPHPWIQEYFSGPRGRAAVR